MEQTKQYEYVDLGLPSGLKWATMNVGATHETDYGYYFQWGDVEDKSNSDCSWKTAGFLTLAWLWVHSVYVCLGCFFRRNSWIITSVILFVATTTLTFVASMLSLDFFNHNIHFHNGLYIGGELYVIDGYSIIATVVLLLTGFTVLNYWLAYKLFCRMQVINNKWINV